MDSKLFYKESVLPVTLFCSALMFSPVGATQVNAATNVVQQAKTVKGTVVDNMGEAVIGASVKVVGTTTGAVTDLDGNFTLTNVPKNATVEISYIGYIAQKISVAGKSDLKVTLQEDNKALDEVVVVAYGTARKGDLTGALTTMRPDANEAAKAVSIDNLLEGKVQLENYVKKMGINYLSPSEKVTLNKLTGEMIISRAEVKNAKEWMNGGLFFDEMPLSDIVKELNRSYNVKIHIADEQLTHNRFYALFNRKEQTIYNVLDIITATNQVRYKVEGDSILLYAK